MHTWIVNDLESVRKQVERLRTERGSQATLGRTSRQRRVVDRPLAAARRPASGPRDATRPSAITRRCSSAHRAALGLGDARPVRRARRARGSVTSAGRSRSTRCSPTSTRCSQRRERGSTTSARWRSTPFPTAVGRLGDKAGLAVDDVDWLHRMWADKPVWWLVAMADRRTRACPCRRGDLDPQSNGPQPVLATPPPIGRTRNRWCHRHPVQASTT